MENYKFNQLTNEYLIGIRFNNYKNWFHEHKAMYDENVHKPMVMLANEIYDKMHSMDENFLEIPKISRANRDIRFSKNKNPYKECKWFFLRGDGKPDITYPKPTYFFEISPDWWRYGLFFCPKPEGMKLFRDKIDANRAGFITMAEYAEGLDKFVFEGEEYKRLFNKENSAEINKWYQKKWLQFVCWKDYSQQEFYSDKLADIVFEDFKTLYPIYKYLL